MYILTKFDIGDNVWFMENNKPTEGKVSSIEIFNYETKNDYIKYNAYDIINPSTWLDHANLYEQNLYASKTKLLESL